MRWYDWALVAAVCVASAVAGCLVGYAQGFFTGWVGV